MADIIDIEKRRKLQEESDSEILLIDCPNCENESFTLLTVDGELLPVCNACDTGIIIVWED